MRVVGVDDVGPEFLDDTPQAPRRCQVDFRAGRKAVLEDLLAHDTLFHSDAARERWEEKARANVSAEVAALS